MKLNDATRSFGSVGSLLSVLLLCLVSAGAAFACPEHGSKVVYRTSRAVPSMRTTVISYGGPCSGEMGYNAPRARKVKYVTMRDDDYYTRAPRYVAMRNVDSYYPTSSARFIPMNRTRYVAVRNVDYDYAPRYVAMRNYPAYEDMGTRYVSVRSNYVPRTRYVAVRNIDMDDYDYAPQYVAVRRAPVYDSGSRYVAVRNIDNDWDDVTPTRYVSVRNSGAGCACPAAVRNDLDDFETMNARHVVVKDDYIDGTQEVIYQSPSYDDTAYFAVPKDSFHSNVGYNDLDDNDMSYVGNGTVSYVPAHYDSDFDDQAILDTGGATYVAANDIEDACLSSRTSYRASPRAFRKHAVNYVPVVDDEDNFVGEGTSFVAANDINESCSCAAGSQNISYIPADHWANTTVAPVSYVEDENVNYIPARHRQHIRPVTYVPVENVEYVDTADTDACECPVSDNSFVTDQFADTSAIVEDNDNDLSNDVSYTETVAGETGFRDGFEEGKVAAINGFEYRPAALSDFQTTTDYRYRDSFLRGYSAGFNSVNSTD